ARTGDSLAARHRETTQGPRRWRDLDRQDHAFRVLLAEAAKTSDREIVIEDTRKLQRHAPNLVALRTKDGVASLLDLVGAEALDLLKAWGTAIPEGSARSTRDPRLAQCGVSNSSSRKPW